MSRILEFQDLNPKLEVPKQPEILSPELSHM